MSDFIDIIQERRSVRRFTDQAVSEQDLATILQAVQWSPSWANTQCWEVIVVGDSDRKRALQEILGRNPAHDAMIQADRVLVVCGRKNKAGFKKDGPTTRYGDWMQFDLGIATQSLCLAAHALGLGTVIVGSFDHTAVEETLEIPEEYAASVMIPLGHPDGPTKAPPRRPVEEWTHEERFRK